MYGCHDPAGRYPVNFKKMTWAEMAQTVDSIHTEMKRRNPIFINAYAPTVKHAALLLKEIARGEAGNFTSECGPKEPSRTKKRKYKTHWAKLNRDAFCGAPLSVETHRNKAKVTCETCLKLMRLHGHLGELR